MWIFDDASGLEQLWTYWNGGGAILASGLCYDVFSDTRSNALMADDARRKATYLCIGVTFILVGAMLVYTLIGLVAMTQPPSVRIGTSPTQYIAAGGFLFLGTVKVLFCGYWRYLRHRLREEGADPALTLGKAGSV